MSRPSFLGYLIAFGGALDLPSIPQKDQYPQQKKAKSENRFIAHHIREQNKAKLRQASNHGLRFRAW